MAKKKAVRKKAVRTSRKKKVASSTGVQRKNLNKLIDSLLKHITSMKKKNEATQKKIDQAKKKAQASKKGQAKVKAVFELEGLKINSFNALEPYVKSMVPLMNKAYSAASKIGGKIQNDYLDICQDLTKGFNIATLEKDLKKLKKDLAA